MKYYLLSLTLAMLGAVFAQQTPQGKSAGINGEGIGVSNQTPFLTALGGTTAGRSLFQVPNPSSISFVRINANNTASLVNAATMRTDLGGTATGQSLFTTANGTGTRFFRVNDDDTTSLLTASEFRSEVGIFPSSQPNAKNESYLIRETFRGIGLNDPITTVDNGVISGAKDRIANPGPGKVTFTFGNFSGSRVLTGRNYLVNSEAGKGQVVRSKDKITIVPKLALVVQFTANSYTRDGLSLGWGNTETSVDSSGVTISNDGTPDGTKNVVTAINLFNPGNSTYSASFPVSRNMVEDGETYRMANEWVTTTRSRIWIQGGIWDRLYGATVGTDRWFPLIDRKVQTTNASLYAIFSNYCNYGSSVLKMEEFSVIQNFSPSQDLRILDYFETGTAAHIPAILPLPDGTEIATWQKGTADASPDQSLWGAVKTASGWTEAQSLIPSLGDGSVLQNGSMAIINGQIWWIYSRSNAAVTAYPHYRRVLTAGSNGVISMGPEIAIPALAVGYLVYGPPLQTATGRIIIPAETYDATGVSPFIWPALVYSDNNGSTWSTVNYNTPAMPGHVPEFTGYNAEMTISIEPDGTTLRAITRTDFRGTAANPPNPQGMSLTATSTTNGTTWSTFEPYLIPQPIGGNNGDKGQRVVARKMPDGRIMAFGSDNQRDRTDLTAYIIGQGGRIDDQMTFATQMGLVNPTDSLGMQYPDGFYKDGILRAVYAEKTGSGSSPTIGSGIWYVANKWRSGRPRDTRSPIFVPAPQHYARATVPRTVGLVDAATVALNADEGNVFDLLLTSAVGSTRVIGTPVGPFNGQPIRLRVRQAADTGSRAITLDSSWRNTLTLTPKATANGVNILDAVYDVKDAKWDVISWTN